MLTWLKGRIQYVAAVLVLSLNRGLEWLFASRNPTIVFVRELIRRNVFLLFLSRRFIRFVRELPWNLAESFAGRFDGCLESILAAREGGGSISVLELEQVWTRVERGARVVAISAEPELGQIGILLRAARAKALCFATITAAEADMIDPARFDLVVLAPGTGTEQQIREFASKLRTPEALLRVGETHKRSDYLERNPAGIRIAEAVDGQGRSVGENLARGLSLRVVFLNDVGFQYGAGIALKRQVASFLLRGFEVSLVAWTPGAGPNPPMVTGFNNPGGWRGVHDVSADRRSRRKNETPIVASVLSTIRALAPDVIITGNLHSTGFPLELAQGLKTIDAMVVSYMHDCFWATGRCAYPVSCQLYQTGCNETCPTADEYPQLAPDKIKAAWLTKTAIFEGEDGIPLVTNSGWTRDLAVRRFGDRARIDCVHLGLDHELFAPIPKAVARRLLGLPTDGVFVVMGAVDILNKWKGGDLFREIHARLSAREDVSLLLFGNSSALLKSTRSFGLVQDERLMPFILNSADLFVGTATEEAFGQTLLEASACGIPVVAFDRGGVSDVVVNEETGLLVKDLSVDELYVAIERLLADASLRESLGKNARKRVESYFTLTKQADAWIDYLKTRASSSPRSMIAVASESL